ncbi:MAG: hypothetical protein JWL69_44 [Phycisphaerales bacterium]|nr:hypothetical protein [Phycisphaerales bacterium]MDB5355947.1 hypothetical protein [Phycisphaerales bacterium]
MTATHRIDTGHVSNRRTLHFSGIDGLRADVDRIVAAEVRGKARCLGNWCVGQNFGHVASWIDYSFDGVPMKVPFFVKLFLRPMKNRFIYKPMPAGRNIPKVPGGTLGTEPLPTEQGHAKLVRALDRLKAGPPNLPHLLFGMLTHDQWINTHLRHAELHLSFITID